jgi:hypothetical protein
MFQSKVDKAGKIMGEAQAKVIAFLPGGVDETISGHPGGRTNTAKIHNPAILTLVIVDCRIIAMIQLYEPFKIEPGFTIADGHAVIHFMADQELTVGRKHKIIESHRTGK